VEDIYDKMVHLTNDAVQKRSTDYGKFESGNKISYAEFTRYLETTYPNNSKALFEYAILPQIR
jgi:hypothetical protein